MIHIEQAWSDNIYTIQGELLHNRVHSYTRETRVGTSKEYSVAVRSLALGLVGKVDVIEHTSDGAISLTEYKRGKPKKYAYDEAQLCAQALCVEEMIDKPAVTGAIFYGKTRKKKQVSFTDELRSFTKRSTIALHELLGSGKTPAPEYIAAKCDRCSLFDICLPKKLSEANVVMRYMNKMLAQTEEP